MNGKVQPFHPVQKRRYRFRLLDAGPSRFYEFFLTNPANLSQKIPFWVISNDGNLLPRPIEVTSVRVGVAERFDIIVDFNKIAQRFGNPPVIRLENRLEQDNGRGPTGKILPAGQGDQLLEFRLVGTPPGDPSFDPEPCRSPRSGDRHRRRVRADLAAGHQPGDAARHADLQVRPRRRPVADQRQFMDCTRFRLSPQVNTAERWILQNDSGGWQHPIHIHLEEFRILSRNGVPVRPGNVQFARKDVTILADERVELLVRFRDFRASTPSIVTTPSTRTTR